MMVTRDTGEIQIALKELLASLNELRAIRGEPSLTEFAEPPFCSFCGRSRKELGALVMGLSANICFDCVSEARKMFLRERQT